MFSKAKPSDLPLIGDSVLKRASHIGGGTVLFQSRFPAKVSVRATVISNLIGVNA